jgi:hypothetical protein
MKLVSRLLAGLSVVAFALPFAVFPVLAEKGEGYKRLAHPGNGASFIDFSSKRQKQYKRNKTRKKAIEQYEQSAGDDEEATEELVVYRPEELVTLKLL